MVQHNSIDHSGLLSVSYASNSTTVSTASAAGASSLVSRADHVHRRGFIGARSSRSTNQAITTATWTGVQMNVADDYDTHAIHDTSTNPSRFTVPVTGNYHVDFLAAFEPNGTGDRWARIAINGAQFGAVADRFQGNATIGNRIRMHDTIPMTAGQYVEGQVYQDSGGNLNINAGQLSIHLVGIV